MTWKHLSDEQISAFLDGEIITEEERKHLEQCEDCASKLNSYKVISKSLGELSFLSLSSDATNKIKVRILQEKLSTENSKPRVFSKLKYVVYSLGSFAVIGLIISIMYLVIYINGTNDYSGNLPNLTRDFREKNTEDSQLKSTHSSESMITDEEEPTELFLILASLSEEYELDKRGELFDVVGLSNLSLLDVVLSLSEETGLLEENLTANFSKEGDSL
ncbi:MAG: hypothetical protein N3G21_08755 [Candidatus Hydrogenedentes bacterium]|nr:hypothetical protein [Candidatus Hydrogenedentota bacterium]